MGACCTDRLAEYLFIMTSDYAGARSQFVDAGIGFRGGYGYGGDDCHTSVLLALLLARGGWKDDRGHNHECSDWGMANAILDRMNVQERQTLVHDARDALSDQLKEVSDRVSDRVKDSGDRISERVKDTRDDVRDSIKDTRDDIRGSIRDAKDCISEKAACISERITDRTEDLKDRIGDVRFAVRDIDHKFDRFEREFCDHKSDTRAGFKHLENVIERTSLTQELREAKDKLDNERRFSDREFLEKKLCRTEDRLERDFERECGGRRSRGGCGDRERDLVSFQDLLKAGLLVPACQSNGNGNNGHGND